MDSEYRGDDEIDAAVDSQPTLRTPEDRDQVRPVCALRLDGPHEGRGGTYFNHYSEVDILVTGCTTTVRIHIRETGGQITLLDFKPDDANQLGNTLMEAAFQRHEELAAG